jgi:hypothetical protein
MEPELKVAGLVSELQHSHPYDSAFLSLAGRRPRPTFLSRYLFISDNSQLRQDEQTCQCGLVQALQTDA